MNETTTPPTQAERDFAFRYYKEECLHTYDGPAHQCTNEHDISNGSMIVFGYWEQRNNDCWFNQLLEDEAPPFRVSLVLHGRIPRSGERTPGVVSRREIPHHGSPRARILLRCLRRDND